MRFAIDALSNATANRERAIQARWDARRNLRVTRDALAKMQPLKTPKSGGRAGRELTVRRHIEALHASASKIDRAYFRSGVYALFHGDTIVYIGQAINVAARVGQHSEKQFDRVAFIEVPKHRLDDIERRLIRTLAPNLNSDSWSRSKRKGTAQCSTSTRTNSTPL
jgi:hypothetical protein